MSVICEICVSPSLRGQVDADIVRKLTLKELSQKYRLSSRRMMRHIKHLPEKLESEASASKPSIYIGSVTYNINLIVSAPKEEDVAADDQGLPDPEEEEALGHA
jgi:hypothetical protein